MSKVPMTVAGEAALREELDRLKRVDRPRIVEAIAVAREHGDLKENAEYHAAREQQSFNEGRVLEIESKLSNIQVIDVTKIPHTGKVNALAESLYWLYRANYVLDMVYLVYLILDVATGGSHHHHITFFFADQRASDR